MKSLSVCFLLFLSLNTYSQARIGYSRNEIVEEFSQKFVVKNEMFGDVPVILVYNEKYTTYYSLDDLGFCYMTVISPKSKTYFDEIANRYNKNYSVVGDSIWVSNNYGSNIKIKIVTMTDVGPCFVITKYQAR